MSDPEEFILLGKEALSEARAILMELRERERSGISYWLLNTLFSITGSTYIFLCHMIAMCLSYLETALYPLAWVFAGMAMAICAFLTEKYTFKCALWLLRRTLWELTSVSLSMWDFLSGAVRHIKITTKPISSVGLVSIQGSVYIRTVHGDLVIIPDALLPQVAALNASAVQLESSQLGSTLQLCQQTPPGHFALRSSNEIIGLGFRVGDHFYTAKHVWAILNESFEIVTVNIDGLAYAMTFAKGELKGEDLGDDIYRFTSMRAVQRAATLGIRSLSIAPPCVNTETIVHTLSKGKWFCAFGRAVASDLKALAPFKIMFEHTCTTENGTSGSAVMQKKKVVGIHLGSRQRNVAAALVHLDPEWLKSVPDPKVMPVVATPAPAGFKVEARVYTQSLGSSSSSDERQELVDRKRDEYEERQAERDQRDDEERELDILRVRMAREEDEIYALDKRTDTARDREEEEDLQKEKSRRLQKLDQLREHYLDELDARGRGYNEEQRKRFLGEARTPKPDFAKTREPARGNKYREAAAETSQPQPAVELETAQPRPTAVETPPPPAAAPPTQVSEVPKSETTGSTEVKNESSFSGDKPGGTPPPAESTTSSTKSEPVGASPPQSKSKKRRARKQQEKSSQSSNPFDGLNSGVTQKSDHSSSTLPGPTPTTPPLQTMAINNRLIHLEALLTNVLSSQESMMKRRR